VTDLLTHVLLAHVCGTALSWRYDAVETRHVALAMAGATLPDASKLSLLVGSTVEVGGVAFAPIGLHRLGPTLALALATALLVEPAERRAAAVALVAGGLSHLSLDLGVVRAAPTAPPYPFPLSWWRPPNPELYTSSDVVPTVVAVVLAAATLLYDRRRDAGERADG